MIDASQTNSNESIGQFFKALETDNLPVKFIAVRSRYTAQHNHQRFAAHPRLGAAFFEVEDPTVPGCLLVARRPSKLSRQRHRAPRQGGKHHYPDDPASHAQLSFRTQRSKPATTETIIPAAVRAVSRQ
jgi:hypothetical protein